jgi:hypothetical protein
MLWCQTPRASGIGAGPALKLSTPADLSTRAGRFDNGGGPGAGRQVAVD